MKKQLKMWHQDFFRYWDRTSLVARIFTGAAVSFLLVTAVTKYLTRPIAKEIKALRKKAETTDIGNEATIQLEELRQKKQRYLKRITAAQDKFSSLRESRTALTQAESGKLILEIRKLLDKYRIKLLEEEKLKTRPKPVNKSTSYRSSFRPVKKDNRIRIKVPDYLDIVSYRFKVVGSYNSLRRFLYYADRLGRAYVMNNISLSGAQQKSWNGNAKPVVAVKLDFEVHIPYLKDSSLLPANNSTKQAL
ncbi:hypothetical protein P0136_09215 [Lentisphaerota bacterium ZTH]|nr:hypothetical protein JYG24_13275 [Lentisphaerota bacterium]WET05542.1 hypothetical protein P0136_09215 [Lentisphaerota bacterium ZTH]